MGAESEPGAGPTRALVKLGAVRENFRIACARAEGREVIAVVKAGAYGHGAVPVVGALLEAGCRRLAVLSVDEGLELRGAGVEVPILVMGGVDAAPRPALEAGLTPVVHNRDQLGGLRAAASRADAALPVHVEVDTGMRRAGVPAHEALALLEALAAEPALELEGVFTHFARADEPDLAPSLEQLARFRELLAAARARGITPRLVHCANSAGLLAGKPLFEALPEANAVRPGLMLFGVSPAPHFEVRLQPAMALLARVQHVRRLEAGDVVGYGALFRAERPTRVATLALGYADGVPVAASGRGSVRIGGRRHPIVGRVSMDYIGVDVGDAAVRVGDEALLFGESADGALPVEEAAAAADTIAYELLVRVGPRVARVYDRAGR